MHRLLVGEEVTVKQRKKLYDCEDAVWPEYGTPTPEAAQGWYDWVARTKWWRDHSSVKHIRIKYPVFGKFSGIVLEDNVAVVEFGPFSLVKECLLHELGHVLDYHEGTGEAAMERDHNPKFAGILLALVRRYMSAGEADELQKEFEARKVRWDPYE
jgi:hypothetical protein